MKAGKMTYIILTIIALAELIVQGVQTQSEPNKTLIRPSKMHF